MSKLIAMKHFSELSIFFAMVYLVIKADNLLYSEVICILCTFGIYIAKRATKINEKCRFLGLVIVFGLVIWGISEGLYWQTIIPASYSLIVIVLNRLEVYYWQYQVEMKCELFIMGVLLGISMLGQLEYFPSFIFGLIAFFIGALLLRELRLGGGLNRKGKLLDFSLVFGVICGSLLAGAILNLFLRYTATILIWIFIPVGLILNIVSYIAIIIKDFLFPNFDIFDHPIVEKREESIWDIINGSFESARELESSQQEVDGMTRIIETFGLCVIIALVMLIIYIIIRFFMLRQDDHVEKMEFDKSNNRNNRFFSRERRKQKNISNSQKIREIYIKYLQYLKKQGIHVSIEDTSYDVLKNSEKVEKYDESVRLRELYIRARYQDEERILDSDVKEAMMLYKTIIG